MTKSMLDNGAPEGFAYLYAVAAIQSLPEDSRAAKAEMASTFAARLLHAEDHARLAFYVAHFERDTGMHLDLVGAYDQDVGAEPVQWDSDFAVFDLHLRRARVELADHLARDTLVENSAISRPAFTLVDLERFQAERGKRDAAATAAGRAVNT